MESIENNSEYACNSEGAFHLSTNSMFVGVDDDSSFNDSAELSWVPSVEPDVSKKSDIPSGGHHRQSVVMQPVAGFRGLLGADFDDSDYDEDDAPKPEQGVAAEDSNPNHRVMVGGFAAAAYEAARADHYRRKGNAGKKPIPPGTGQAPSM